MVQEVCLDDVQETGMSKLEEVSKDGNLEGIVVKRLSKDSSKSLGARDIAF